MQNKQKESGGGGGGVLDVPDLGGGGESKSVKPAATATENDLLDLPGDPVGGRGATQQSSCGDLGKQ